LGLQGALHAGAELERLGLVVEFESDGPDYSTRLLDRHFLVGARDPCPATCRYSVVTVTGPAGLSPGRVGPASRTARALPVKIRLAVAEGALVRRDAKAGLPPRFAKHRLDDLSRLVVAEMQRALAPPSASAGLRVELDGVKTSM
jgi:hypothetical protein